MRASNGVRCATLAGASDTLESETDTFIAAVVLVIAAMFYLPSPTRGGHASINLSALSCANHAARG